MENNNLNNLPPFYIGQKVTYVGRLIEYRNKINTIKSITKLNCGCFVAEIDNFLHGNYGVCGCCKSRLKEYFTGYFVMCSSLRPLQESVFPSLTMSKVLEKESQLISMN